MAGAHHLLRAVTAPAGEADTDTAPLALLALTLAEPCTAARELWLSTALTISADTAAYLAPADGARLWQRLAGTCGASEERGPWLRLFAAVAARDAAAMATAAVALRAEAGVRPIEQRRYLLATLVLALLAHGDAGPAAAVWATEREALFGDDTLPLWLALLDSLLGHTVRTGGG